MKKLALSFIAITALFTIVLTSCKDDDKPAPATPAESNEGTFTDTRDDKTYKTIKIGTQTWMAENLNYEGALSSGTSTCAATGDDNCAVYGREYDKEAASITCPNGWHLPSDKEWRLLEHNLGMTDIDTAKTGISEDRGADQNIGTKLRQGGSSKMNLLIVNNDVTFFWTSTLIGGSYYNRSLNPTDDGSIYRETSSSGRICIRCIKD